jgi:hypothetical protein
MTTKATKNTKEEHEGNSLDLHEEDKITRLLAVFIVVFVTFVVFAAWPWAADR